ncbi:hypothetical protein NLJ89_g10400 [Agrocybe chaxingu]|uniref:Uncharacterized protein n=1 Tax=Agrocybe chaxingu TaxID=84603 RepID=A0A9W8JNY6_9AGAR|nr:hypothetical protein NLJ89_g10400 [Agrocybe chaxingu]
MTRPTRWLSKTELDYEAEAVDRLEHHARSSRLLDLEGVGYLHPVRVYEDCLVVGVAPAHLPACARTHSPFLVPPPASRSSPTAQPVRAPHFAPPRLVQQLVFGSQLHVSTPPPCQSRTYLHILTLEETLPSPLPSLNLPSLSSVPEPNS